MELDLGDAGLVRVVVHVVLRMRVNSPREDGVQELLGLVVAVGRIVVLGRGGECGAVGVVAQDARDVAGSVNDPSAAAGPAGDLGAHPVVAWFGVCFDYDVVSLAWGG